MTCKGGVCSRTTKDKKVIKALDRMNKPGQFTTEVHKTKEEAYEKGCADTTLLMEGIIADNWREGFDHGLWMQKNTDMNKYVSIGILVGGIVSAVIFAFFK